MIWYFLGDQSEQIHFSGYQVSNQCAALVDANVLCPTSFPELAYVREKPLSPTHYIPDVHYTVFTKASHLCLNDISGN